MRGAIGQLNWLANISHLEISFQVSNISAKITEATVQDIRETNKTRSCFVRLTSPIFTYTDSISLQDNRNTTTQVADCRLRVEISAIKEQQDNVEISMH